MRRNLCLNLQKVDKSDGTRHNCNVATTSVNNPYHDHESFAVQRCRDQ